MGTKRDDIIKASIEIFVNEGFDRPSMDSIANRAHVSKRTLYKHFANKHALLNEILLYLVNQNQNALQFSFNPDKNVQEQLQSIIAQKAKHILCPSNLKLSRIILCESLKGEGVLKDKIKEVLKNEKVTLTWIENAQLANFLTKDRTPLQLLDSLNELINGVIFFPILFEKKQAVSQTEIEDVASMFLHVNADLTA